jgi:hypothetical protein
LRFIPDDSKNDIKKMRSNEKAIRPQLVKWLCIISATSGILWIIMFLVLLASSFTGKIPGPLFPRIVLDYFYKGYWFILLEILLTALGLTGVFMMWQMKKNGFYLYAAAKTMIYFLPILFIGSNHYNFLSLSLTSFMIIMYGVAFSNRTVN